MNKFKVVFKNVFLQNVKSPFFVSMLLIPLFICGFFYFISKEGSKKAEVAVFSTEPEIAQTFKKIDNKDVNYTTKYKTKKSAQEAMINKDIDGYLVLKVNNGETSAVLYDTNQSTEISNQSIELDVNQIALGVKASYLKLPPSMLKKITTPTEFKEKTSTVSNKKLVIQDQAKTMGKFFSVMIFSVILFFILIFYVIQIATNIGQEKGERVMEVILSSVDAKSQFLGEVFGVFSTFLIQILVYILFIVGIFAATYNSTFMGISIRDIDLSVIFGPEMLFSIIFGLVGVFLYLIVAGMLGSLVSSVEQINQAIMPLIFPAMVAYFLTIFSMTGVLVPVAKVCSFIPFISQSIMPSLVVIGKASWTEAFISLLVTIVTTVVIAAFSVKMYRSNVLVYSQKGVWDSLKSSLTLGKKSKAVK